MEIPPCAILQQDCHACAQERLLAEVPPAGRGAGTAATPFVAALGRNDSFSPFRMQTIYALVVMIKQATEVRIIDRFPFSPRFFP